MQNHHGLFPAPCRPEEPTSAANFAFNIGRANIQYFDVIQLFNRIPYLNLVGILVYFKGIGISGIGKMHPLLGHNRPDYYIVFVHLGYHLRTKLIVLFPVQQRQKCVFGKQHLDPVANASRIQVRNLHQFHFGHVPNRLDQIVIAVLDGNQATAINL